MILYHSYLGHNLMNEDFGFIEKVKNNFNLYEIFIRRLFRADVYRPITRDIFYAVSYALFALNPLGYRIIVFILFILNNFLVYEIVGILTKRKDVALAASIFYLTRGAHNDALYWIPAGFQETGVTLFVLSAILLYLQYAHHKRKIFYVSSLICSTLAFMSKETSVILILLILLIELYMQKINNNFNLRKLFVKIAPFGIIALIYIVRTCVVSVNYRGDHYSMEFSLDVLLKNITYYIAHSFNTGFETFVLCVLIACAFLKVENRKYAALSILWFLIGLLPFIFMKTAVFPFYLTVALIGFSILLAIGIKYVHDTFYPTRYILTPIVYFILIYSVHANANELNQEYYTEKISNNIISYLKYNFPSFPDGSLIYIKNPDGSLWYALGYGSAIRLQYGKNIAVYYEGMSKKLPTGYNQIYYFAYNNNDNTLRFIEKRDQ